MIPNGQRRRYFTIDIQTRVDTIGHQAAKNNYANALQAGAMVVQLIIFNDNY
jgi:hypothetical protein